MAIEIGKGKSSKERNEIAKRTLEFLKKHNTKLYGEGNDVELELKLTRDEKITRGSIVISGELKDIDAYKNYLGMVKDLRNKVKAKYGFSLREVFRCINKSTGEYDVVLMSYGYYPMKIKSWIDLKGPETVDYKEALEYFLETTQQFAEKNEMLHKISFPLR